MPDMIFGHDALEYFEAGFRVPFVLKRMTPDSIVEKRMAILEARGWEAAHTLAIDR
jgi:hypothetical protein